MLRQIICWGRGEPCLTGVLTTQMESCPFGLFFSSMSSAASCFPKHMAIALQLKRQRFTTAGNRHLWVSTLSGSQVFCDAVRFDGTAPASLCAPRVLYQYFCLGSKRKKVAKCITLTCKGSVDFFLGVVSCSFTVKDPTLVLPKICVAVPLEPQCRLLRVTSTVWETKFTRPRPDWSGQMINYRRIVVLPGMDFQSSGVLKAPQVVQEHQERQHKKTLLTFRGHHSPQDGPWHGAV